MKGLDKTSHFHWFINPRSDNSVYCLVISYIFTIYSFTIAHNFGTEGSKFHGRHGALLFSPIVSGRIIFTAPTTNYALILSVTKVKKNDTIDNNLPMLLFFSYIWCYCLCCNLLIKTNLFFSVLNSCLLCRCSSCYAT